MIDVTLELLLLLFLCLQFHRFIKSKTPKEPEQPFQIPDSGIGKITPRRKTWRVPDYYDEDKPVDQFVAPEYQEELEARFQRWKEEGQSK